MSRACDRHWKRARGYPARRHVTHGLAVLEVLRAQAPRIARTHLPAARIVSRQDRVRDAVVHVFGAARVMPDELEAVRKVVEELLRASVVVVRECLARLLLSRARDPQWLLRPVVFRRNLHENSEPLNVCSSDYRASFGDTYVCGCGQTGMASYGLGYRQAMTHWHTVMPGIILDGSHVDLAQEPEATMPKVVGLCCLGPEQGCVDVAGNRAAVAAINASQARTPLAGRALGEWRRSHGWLRGLASGLAGTHAGKETA